jgi:hypothetical protein
MGASAQPNMFCTTAPCAEQGEVPFRPVLSHADEIARFRSIRLHAALTIRTYITLCPYPLKRAFSQSESN